MIQILIIAVIVILLGGILFMSGHAVSRKKTREELRRAIEKFVQSQSQPIPGYDNSYQIGFSYNGKACIYEDYETKGFHDKVHKAFLKMPTAAKLTIQFTEKKHERLISSRPILASEMLSHAKITPRVQIPKELSVFNIVTNDVEMTNGILNDWFCKRVFNKFKNIDAQGRPASSLKILDGVIILEFHPSGLSHPKTLDFEANMGPLETYIKQLMVIRNKIEELQG